MQMSPVKRALGNVKRRMLLITPTNTDNRRRLITPTGGGGGGGGQVGYPAEYARYRQQGRFGDAPGKPSTQQKGAQGGEPDMHLEAGSMERTREAAKDRDLEEDRLKHEERLALISQGINPDSMQPFTEETEARAMLLDMLQQQEEEGEEDFWSERDFIKRADLLKRSAVPGAKIGKQGQFGKTQFKEMHLEK